MNTPFAAVMIGLVSAAVMIVALSVQYALCSAQARRRPRLPEEDQPPRRLRALTSADVPGEVSRGLAQLIGELRREASGR